LDSVDVLVVGAGVVGLAIAREFAMAGKEVVVLEAERHYGTGTSSRNSGVVHAGIYYPTASKKAQWCVRGRHLLYEYARARHIDHKPVGKLIVAQQAQAARLEALHAAGLGNGVDDLMLIDGHKARRFEPSLGCDLAVYSPSTGIIDAHALMHALLGDAQAHGAVIAVESRFQSAEQVAGRWHSEVLGETIRSDVLINSAGLDAISIARRINGIRPDLIPEMFFAKGNYARLMGRCPFTRLIYPVPVPGGLGTHLTLDLGGQASFGPDVEWVPSPTPEQADKGLLGHFSYQVDEGRLARFEADVRTWWPGLPDHALAPGYAGVRPKLVGPDQPAADYLVQGPKDHGLEGLVNLMGIESPGLTSCLAIAQAVREIV